jgi:hypothetical protein
MEQGAGDDGDENGRVELAQALELTFHLLRRSLNSARAIVNRFFAPVENGAGPSDGLVAILSTVPLTRSWPSVPMRAVKISLSLLTLVAFALTLTGCDTLANRRSLYAPKKGEGYWTRTLHEGTWKKRGPKPADETIKRGGARETAPASVPLPPPPPPPLPEAAAPAL